MVRMWIRMMMRVTTVMPVNVRIFIECDECRGAANQQRMRLLMMMRMGMIVAVAIAVVVRVERRPRQVVGLAEGFVAA